MKCWLQLEEIAQCALSITLFSQLPYPWWLYPLFFFTPDLSLLAMVVTPRLGEFVYNLVHHKGLAIGLFLLGVWFHQPSLSFAGMILFSHSSLDRLLGYGLKNGADFTHAPLKLFTP